VAAALVALVVASAAIGIAPSLVYQREYGANARLAQRSADEAELYGLRIAPMLLPVEGHRIASWAAVRKRYDERAARNESSSATLGLVTGAGFLLLLGWAITAIGRRSGRTLLDGLAALNGAGLLLATTSGFGALIALLGFPQIRAYNRISIWLAFFALAALVAATRPLHERLVRSRGGTALGLALLVLALALALADVMSPQFRPKRPALIQTVENDRAFVEAAEALLPESTAVFQLPYVEYPEAAPPGQMMGYDSLRPYLYSRTLRWSHGAMKGRPGADAIAALAAQPAAALPDALARAGYGALLVDRFGYAPGDETTLRAALEPRLGTPLTSEGGRLLLYRLPSAAAVR
jgi:phosphoglycerol transferase